MIKRRQARHVRSFLDSSKLRKKRRRRQLVRRIFVYVFSVLFLIGLICLFRAPWFQLKNISIEGNQHIVATDIEQKIRTEIMAHKPLFGLVQPTSSLFIDNGNLENILRADFLRIKDVDVHVSLTGHVKVKIEERQVFGNWCQEINCYEMDENGLLFDITQSTDVATTSSTSTSTYLATTSELIFKGFLNEVRIGSQFLDTEMLVKIVELANFLEGKKMPTEYISCQTDLICIMALSQNRKVIIDITQDMKQVSGRLGVALESKPLIDLKFAYIDTRFGNKLFYKIKETEPVIEDVSADEEGFASTSNEGTEGQTQ